ncbi:MAG: ABC transporter substrate-binding protein [Solirubrobacterales bacterium]
MMMLRSRLAATVAILAVLSTACGSNGSQTGGGASGGTPKRGGTLQVVRYESFDGWVLDSAAAYASYQTDMAVIEPLVRFGSDGKSLQPGLARSWRPNATDTRWTFTLQPKARFSTGQPVASADVAFSASIWKKGPNFGSTYAGIKAVQTPNPHTAVFVLSAPDSTLPVKLSWSSSGVMPNHFGGKTSAEYYQHPIGAGAFQVVSWTSDGQIVLKRNPFFYDPKRPYLDKVVINVVKDNNERSTMFQAGQADLVEYVSPDTAAQYPQTSLDVLPPSQVEHLSMNTTTAPFNDPTVRQAVAYAINYKDIAQGAMSGYGQLPTGIMAPNVNDWAPPSKPYFSTDLAKAKQLMASSSQPNGATVNLVYDAGSGIDTLIAQIVKSNLAQIGITANLQGLETGTFIGDAFGLKDPLVLWSYGPISPDASDPLAWLVGTNDLFTGYDAAWLKHQYDAYTASDSDTTKQRIITQIQDWYIDHVPAVALTQGSVIHATASNVHGFAPAPWGLYYYDRIWLSQ